MKTPKRSARRTGRELFLSKLEELTKKEPLITNQLLKEKLGWDDDKYKRIKAELLSEDKIIVSRGHGGKIGLADSTLETLPVNVFISYSHMDEDLKIELVKHLNPLERLGVITTWNDRKIKAGDIWDEEISGNIESATVVILLVSIDFINSKYCYDVELEKAFELHDKGKAVVIPVILRNCMWQHTPFAKYQALPKDGKAVKSFLDADEAFTGIAEGIMSKVKDLLSNE